MTYRIAINGFGRIGRNYLRCLLDKKMIGIGYEVVAVNDLVDTGMLAHLLAYDSTFGRLQHDVGLGDGVLTVGDQTIRTFRDRSPENLPWADLGGDLVIERPANCGLATTRHFTRRRAPAGC